MGKTYEIAPCMPAPKNCSMNIEVGEIPYRDPGESGTSHNIRHKPINITVADGRYTLSCSGFGASHPPASAATKEDALKKARKFIRNNRGTCHKKPLGRGF